MHLLIGLPNHQAMVLPMFETAPLAASVTPLMTKTRTAGEIAILVINASFPDKLHSRLLRRRGVE